MTDLRNNPLTGRPEDIPGWAPHNGATLTEDSIIREYCRVAFDGSEPANVRMKAMEFLGKHKGMLIERKDVRTLDVTRQAALTSAFEQVPIEDRIEWLNRELAANPGQELEAQAALPPATQRIEDPLPPSKEPTPIDTPESTKPDPDKGIPDLFI